MSSFGAKCCTCLRFIFCQINNKFPLSSPQTRSNAHALLPSCGLLCVLWETIVLFPLCFLHINVVLFLSLSRNSGPALTFSFLRFPESTSTASVKITLIATLHSEWITEADCYKSTGVNVSLFSSLNTTSWNSLEKSWYGIAVSQVASTEVTYALWW